ncbi:MAG TPA: S9 family peptidase [Edaphobacter sp.]|nr:S9 family peptidase [Edaphobacter sp.]
MKTLRYISLFLFPTMLLGQATQLTLEDLLSDEGAARSGSAMLSPDGRFFAEQQHGQIALVPVGGGSTKVITDTPAAKSEPNWSSDSRQIAFVSDGDIWIVGIDSGKPRRLTHDPAGPGDPRGASDHHPIWNPNGKWILYQSGRKGFDELYVVSKDGAHEELLAATEIYSGTDVITSNVQDHGDAVSSDRFDPAPSWSPDGTRISYTERSRRFFSGKLKVLPFDQETGAVTGPTIDLYIAKNDRGGAWAVNTVAWAPDGKTLAVVLQESGWDKVWLLPAKGGKPKPLTEGAGEDENPAYSPDGKWIAFISNRDLPEERHVWVVAVKGGVPHRVTQLPGIESGEQWSPDSKSIYFLRSTTLRAPVRYVAKASGEDGALPLKPLSPSKYEGLGIAPEVAHFKGKDGLPLAGILYKPAGYQTGKRYPTVIWAHGGPEAQAVLSLTPWSLFLADHGYLVLEPNFRGSTGYGEHFRNLNVKDSGGGEIEDIEAAKSYLVNAGLADPKRVAIGGGSHGGTVVANAVTKLPDTFAAGIEMFGVVDRALFLEYTNRNSKIRWETKMGGTPVEQPAVYRKANILPDVFRIKTPLLILHGEQDPQVPPQESAEFAEALTKAGKTHIYITYPQEGHGFQRREHRTDAYQRQLSFLEKYLKSATLP